MSETHPGRSLWVSAQLVELVEPRRVRRNPAEARDVPYIGMEDVEAHTMRLLGTVPAHSMKSSAATFEKGDVLYGRLRPYLNKVVRPDFSGLASSEFIVFPDTTHLRSSFLQYRLNAQDFVSFASHLNAGDRPRVDFEQIGSFKVDIPPPKEQERIVEKIDELFSDLDASVAALERARANLKRYRAAVLKAAVEGRLTAEWRKANPPAEPADKLLERILAERRRKWEETQLAKYAAQGKQPPKGWKDKYSESAKPDTANLPELPEGWCWTCLGQCFNVVVGATPSRKEQSYWNGAIPWVSSGEVQFCRIHTTRECITQNGLDNSSTQLNPAGSVLLGMIGEGKTRGQAAILEIVATNNQNCAAIWVPETPIPSEFLYYWLYSRYEETRTRGSGNNQPALNKTLVEQIPLPLPPLSEQFEIVRKLEEKLSGMAAAEVEIERGATRASRLRQSILKRAFEGKLVPQDPSDEPASVLLERIRAARAAQNPPRAQKRRQAPA